MIRMKEKLCFIQKGAISEDAGKDKNINETMSLNTLMTKTLG